MTLEDAAKIYDAVIDWDEFVNENPIKLAKKEGFYEVLHEDQ